MHAAEFDTDGMGNEEERAVCVESERVVTVAMWVPSAERLYLAVREENFSESMTRRLGAVLDCFQASCSADEWSLGMLK